MLSEAYEGPWPQVPEKAKRLRLARRRSDFSVFFLHAVGTGLLPTTVVLVAIDLA